MQKKAIFFLFILLVIFFKLPSQEEIDLKHLETALRKGHVSGITFIYKKESYFFRSVGNSHFESHKLRVNPYALRDKVESIYNEPDFPEHLKIPIKYGIKKQDIMTFY